MGRASEPAVTSHLGKSPQATDASVGVLRGDMMLGQAWLIRPAPPEDLRNAELEWARLADLLEQLRANQG